MKVLLISFFTSLLFFYGFETFVKIPETVVFYKNITNGTKSFSYIRRPNQVKRINIDSLKKYDKNVFICRPISSYSEKMDTTIYHKVLGEWKLKKVTKFGPRTQQEVNTDSTNHIFFTKYILDTLDRK